MLKEGSIYFCLQNVGLVLQSFLLHSANRQVIENCVWYGLEDVEAMKQKKMSW